MQIKYSLRDAYQLAGTEIYWPTVEINLLKAKDIFKMTPGRGILQDEKDRATASLVFYSGEWKCHTDHYWAVKALLAFVRF